MNTDAEYLNPVGPQNDQPFVPRPGIYYAAMWSMELPKTFGPFKRGGDVTFQLAREDNKTDRWHLIFRYRYYKNGKVFESDDLRRWNSWQIAAANETEALAKMQEVLKEIATLTGVTHADCLKIGGGLKEFLAAAERDKPAWFHLQMVPKAE